MIDADQEAAVEVVEKTTPLEIQISFETEPPKFEEGDLKVEAITCTDTDKAWSLDLPAVANADSIGVVSISMLTETDGSDLFTLTGNTVTYTGGKDCPAAAEVTLEFLLASDLIGDGK